MSNKEKFEDAFNSSPMDEEIESRLWAYIDGVSTETPAIEELIAANSNWREKYAELLGIHQMMFSAELEQPSLRFTKNVMEEIARIQIAPAAKQYINKRIIWGIASFFIVMLAGFIIYGFAQINWSEASDKNSGLGIDFSAVNYSRMFDNSFVNIFMMINVLLGLLLLDRYLNSKRKKFSGEF